MHGIKLIERGQGSELLKRRCREIGVPVDIVRKLVEAEYDQVGRARRHGLFKRFDEIFGELADGGADVPASNSAA